MEFRQCFDEQNFGLELRTAMLNLAARVPIQDVQASSSPPSWSRRRAGETWPKCSTRSPPSFGSDSG